MKYLAFLILLSSCSIQSSPKFKVGDCVRATSRHNQVDLIIRDVTPEKYVVSGAFKKDGIPMYLSTKIVFTIEELQDYLSAKKIDCSDIE